MTTRALLIDDDQRLHELLVSHFAGQGIQLGYAPDGGRGLAQLESDVFDVVLLDVMMPGLDGLEVLKRIRGKHALPVIMLTARGDETDRIVGLELGADDYVPKPFSARELVARIRAVLRRGAPVHAESKLRAGRWTVDVGARTVTTTESAADLTGLEFDLLAALAHRPGRVVPRDALMELAGRADVTVSDRAVDVHISHLRHKLEHDPKNPDLIKTVRGVGYVLNENAS